jgi:hypothetical protein
MMRPLNEPTAVTRRTKSTTGTKKNTMNIFFGVLLGALRGLGGLCDGARMPCSVQAADFE